MTTSAFKDDLTNLLSEYSELNVSNTPASTLAYFVMSMLETFHTSVNLREQFFERNLEAVADEELDYMYTYNDLDGDLAIDMEEYDRQRSLEENDDTIATVDQLVAMGYELVTDFELGTKPRKPFHAYTYINNKDEVWVSTTDFEGDLLLGKEDPTIGEAKEILATIKQRN